MISLTNFMSKMLQMFSFENGKQEELRQEIFEFFVVFSRFEFALKERGYIKRKEEGKNAEPDWDAFLKINKDNFIVTEDCSVSFQYLTTPETAPNRQKLFYTTESGEEVIKTNWSEQKIDINTPDLKKVIDSIKLVRNNLFHGGKYGDKSWCDFTRTSNLLRHSISMLFVLKELDEYISAYFEDFA